MARLPTSENVLCRPTLLKEGFLVTVQDVLCKTELDLMELLDVPLPELMPALDRVQECVCPPPRSVSFVSNREDFGSDAKYPLDPIKR